MDKKEVSKESKDVKAKKGEEEEEAEEKDKKEDVEKPAEDKESKEEGEGEDEDEDEDEEDAEEMDKQEEVEEAETEGGSEEIDWSKLFTPGLCPENIKGMEGLEYAKLSGDWFLQRTDEPFMADLLPKCHHCQLEVDDDGEFTATEEVQWKNKAFVVENMTGEFEGSKMEVEFFGDKMQLNFEILDTDYDTYMIGYECFDNMKFTLDSDDVEPVHVITMGIATRDPNEAEEKLSELEDKAMELLPFLTKENFAVVEQGDKAQCEY